MKKILNCVELCGAADVCDNENHWCCYGDTDPSTCVDRLEVDYQKILDVVRRVGTVDRLSEICQAERGGRCVVLPCKVGDAVYFIKSCFSYAKSPMRGTVCMIKTFSQSNTFTFGVIMENSSQERSFTNFDIGKTVFLTRAEAEEALKGGTA